MNNKFLFLTGVAALMMAATSCSDDQLDQQPSNQLSDELMIANKENAATVLNGIYYNTEHYYYLTIGQTSQEVMGNDIKMSDGNYGFATYNWLMYAYDYVQYPATVDGWWSAYAPYMWTKAYAAINDCNLLINAYEEGNLVSGAEGFAAEAYGMRAWNFLNLYHLYCNSYANDGASGKGLFLRMSSASANNDDLVERSNLDTSLKQIISDLEKAYSLCESVANKGNYNMNKEAAALLLARTYSELGDWANVRKYADIAADNTYDGSNLMSVTEWQAGFKDANAEWLLGLNFNEETTNIYASFPSFWHTFTSMSPEAVFGTPEYGTKVPGETLSDQMDFLGEENDDTYGAQDYMVGYSTVRATKSFVDTFKKNADGSFCDIRALFPAYLSEKDGYFIAKFNQTATLGVADFPLCRIAEAYLLAAEASMHGNGANGLAILNTLQEARKGSVSTELTEDEIYLERRRELYGEGFALGDLKRMKRGVNRVGVDHWSSTMNLPAGSGKMMFPIPDNELLYNPHYKDNYNAGQNDNWAK